MRVLTFLMVTGCFLLLRLPVCAQSKAERAISGVMAMQEAAWNRADLHEYMTGYWQSDSLLFLGKRGPTYGYTATLNNYLKSYPDTAHTGHLTLGILHMRKLSRQYYFVVGKWDLKRSAGDVGGYFTLLFRKIKGKWFIVTDHTS